MEKEIKTDYVGYLDIYAKNDKDFVSEYFCLFYCFVIQVKFNKRCKCEKSFHRMSLKRKILLSPESIVGISFQRKNTVILIRLKARKQRLYLDRSVSLLLFFFLESTVYLYKYGYCCFD